MTSILMIPPAIEPLSLEEAKAFLRVETGDDDALIAALIAAARLHIESQTHWNDGCAFRRCRAMGDGRAHGLFWRTKS